MKLKHWLETTSQAFNTESVFIYLSNLNGFINILTSISRNTFLEVGWNSFTIQGWSMLGEFCSSFNAVVRLSVWIPLFDCKKWNAVLKANIGCYSNSLLNIVKGSCKWVRHLNIIYPATHMSLWPSSTAGKTEVALTARMSVFVVCPSWVSFSNVSITAGRSLSWEAGLKQKMA